MKKVKILSIDGGGIRGIIVARILVYIEEKVQKISNNPNLRIVDLFDFFAGTSTGGILAALYLVPSTEEQKAQGINAKFTARQALDFYLNNGYSIFNKSKKLKIPYIGDLFGPAVKYNDNNLKNVLQDRFGTLKLSDLLKPIILPTFDILKQENILMINYNKEANHSIPEDFYVTDALRATAAAPTYFLPAFITGLTTNRKIIGIDGGMIANNPTSIAFTESRNLNFIKQGINRPKLTDLLILSLGTGTINTPYKNIKKISNWSLLEWAKILPDLILDSSTEVTHQEFDTLYNQLDNQHFHSYKRIDVPEKYKKYKSDLAEANPENIKALLEAADNTISYENNLEDKDFRLDAYIENLLNH